MRAIRRFYTRVKNLIRWFPVIWKDEDWDDFYIFEVLKFKLKNQADYIGKHDRHVHAKRDAEIMMTCVRLIEKIQEEYYNLEYYSYYEQDFMFVDSKDFPGHSEIKMGKVKKDELDKYFAKYPLVYRSVPDLYAPRLQVALQIGNINEDRALKLLFKLLERNIKRWWD